MSKITSKYQVTLPKAIADQYDIRPGDHIDWIAAGDVIRVIPPGRTLSSDDRHSRLRWFDQATERHSKRPFTAQAKQHHDRGWQREDLYTRGRSH